MSDIEFQPADRNEVIPTIENIKKDLRRKVPDNVLKLKYKSFNKKYPALFRMICRDGDVDMNMLNMIFDSHVQIKEKKMEVNDSWVQLDNACADQYVPKDILEHERKMRELHGVKRPEIPSHVEDTLAPLGSHQQN